MKLAEYDFDVVYRAGKMSVNADVLLSNPVDDNKEKSKHLQVDYNDTSGRAMPVWQHLPTE